MSAAPATLSRRARQRAVGVAEVKRAFATASTVAILLLSACSSNPPIISADTSCERFRHISATPAQIKVFADNWEVMETYADQIVAFNIEYDRHCVGEAK
jgi:hypothetical protein